MPRREFLLGALALGLAGVVRGDDDSLWKKLRGGRHVLLMRHGATDSTLGDSPDMRLADCATQRNLSAEGRAQAQRIGERLRREKVPIANVYTSPWCRCRDTAMLAFGRADEWEPLGSTFYFPEREAQYAEHVKKRIATYTRREVGGNVVMVTHNVNIASLTRLSVAPGEIVVVRPDGCCDLRTVGRLAL